MKIQGPPKKPDGEDNNPPSIQMPSSSESSITYGYYIAFAIESLTLFILLIYLIMSKFNKKTFKETFNKSKRFLGQQWFKRWWCYITNLNNADSSNSNIDFNGYTLYVNGKAIN